jgi:opacity protein-like surface antigen
MMSTSRALRVWTGSNLALNSRLTATPNAPGTFPYPPRFFNCFELARFEEWLRIDDDLKIMKIYMFAAGMAALCLVNYSALAQTNQSATLPDAANNADWTPLYAGDWRMRLSTEYSSVAAGGVNFNGVKGNSGAQSADASLTSEVPLNESWFIPMGVSSHNFFLGTVPGAPIPNQINTLGLNAGLGYHLNDQWTFAVTAGPRFYRLDDIESSGIGIGGSVRAVYKCRPDLMFAFGIAVDPDRDVPVLPGAGVRWDIRTNLTLSVMFPRSGLDYRLNSKLSLFVGFDGEFTVFRAENDQGDKIGMSQFNNGLGTYRDFHVGVGAEYRIFRGFSASVEGGYSFDRELDYQRIDQTVKFDSAPYVQVGFRYRF